MIGPFFEAERNFSCAALVYRQLLFFF